MREVWKPVVGYENYYEVSSAGNVRSVDREISKQDGVVQFRRGREKAKRENDQGYLYVSLNRDGHSKQKMVHILVAEAFVSPRPGPEYEVNHIDFDRKNNDFSNLEWMTHSENVRHSVLHGRHVTSRDMSGENNFNYGNRKLSKFYAENPDVAIEKQSRPGAQNGKARAVRVYMDNDSVLDFDCIKQCAEYIIKVGRSKSSNANNLIPYISNAASRSVLYLGLRFEFI